MTGIDGVYDLELTAFYIFLFIPVKPSYFRGHFRGKPSKG